MNDSMSLTLLFPSVILQNSKEDSALHSEIFGPVISILQVDSEEEALAIENANPYGNAASIYTESVCSFISCS